MGNLRQEQIQRIALKRKKRNGRIWTVAGALCGLLAVLIGVNLYQNQHFEITYYQVESEKIKNPVKAVVLADLHSKEYGENNQELLKAVQEQKPDLILIAGDMINQDDPDVDSLAELCGNLVEIAPVYYCYGNHEAVLMHGLPEGERIPVDQYVKQEGLTFFYNSFITVNVNGNKLAIGGFQGTANGEGFEEWIKAPLEEFEAFDCFKLLISHYPGLYYEGVRPDVDVDLAVAAHYHGGQIRIPGLGGLYHPDDGFFPKYSGGIYELENAALIVSRGLGGHGLIPRIHNRPELVVIEITGREGMQE